MAAMRGPVSRFLSLYSAKQTIDTYRGALARFFRHIENPDAPVRRIERTESVDEELHWLDNAAADYLQAVKAGDADAVSDITAYIALLTVEGYSPSTARMARTAAVAFLEEHGVEFSRLDEKRLKRRTPKQQSVQQEDVLTLANLRSITAHLDIRTKAIVMVMLASGSRLGETLQLRMRDGDLDAEPPTVYFRRETTKTRVARTSFLTAEAKAAVEAWLRVRDEAIAFADRRTMGLVATGRASARGADDERLFAITKTSVYAAWGKAVRRAGLARYDEATQRLTRRVHGCRKTFRSRLGAESGPDLPEILMGHEGYLSTYRRWTEAELAEAYQRHSHVLIVGEGGGDLARQLAEQQASVDRILQENADLRHEMAGIKKEMLELTVFQTVERVLKAQGESR